MVVAFSGLSAVLFWAIEALWKTFAWAYTDRIESIERVFRIGNFQDLKPNQIRTDWLAAWNAEAGLQFLGQLKLWNVMLPHLVVLVACLLLWKFWNLVQSNDRSPPEQNG